MVASVTALTATPAWTQEQQRAGAKAPDTAAGLPPGKVPSGTGQDLPPTEVVSAEDVERALMRLNELMQESQRSLRFQVDELSGRTIITVFDETTKEVVRQIPPPELLALVRRLEQAGSLLDIQS